MACRLTTRRYRNARTTRRGSGTSPNLLLSGTADPDGAATLRLTSDGPYFTGAWQDGYLDARVGSEVRYAYQGPTVTDIALPSAPSTYHHLTLAPAVGRRPHLAPAQRLLVLRHLLVGDAGSQLPIYSKLCKGERTN